MSFLDPFPAMSTPRLRLRAPSLDDVEALYRMDVDPRVHRYFWRTQVASIEAMRQKLESILSEMAAGRSVLWQLEDAASGEFIGNACLFQWDRANCRAEVGYGLLPHAWGRGLVVEALGPVLRFGFDVMNLHSVGAWVHPENRGSIRVLEKVGFRREAHFRESQFNARTGAFEDALVYSLLRGELSAR